MGYFGILMNNPQQENGCCTHIFASGFMINGRLGSYGLVCGGVLRYAHAYDRRGLPLPACMADGCRRKRGDGREGKGIGKGTSPLPKYTTVCCCCCRYYYRYYYNSLPSSSSSSSSITATQFIAIPVELLFCAVPHSAQLSLSPCLCRAR
jgi:hypothetical protein